MFLLFCVYTAASLFTLHDIIQSTLSSTCLCFPRFNLSSAAASYLQQSDILHFVLRRFFLRRCLLGLTKDKRNHGAPYLSVPFSIWTSGGRHELNFGSSNDAMRDAVDFYHQIDGLFIWIKSTTAIPIGFTPPGEAEVVRRGFAHLEQRCAQSYMGLSSWGWAILPVLDFSAIHILFSSCLIFSGVMRTEERKKNNARGDVVVFVPKNVHQHVAVNPFPCALFLALSLSLGPLPPPSAFLELLITSLTPGIGGCCFFFSFNSF